MPHGWHLLYDLLRGHILHVQQVGVMEQKRHREQIAIAGMADMLILNTIEFWTGDNPMAMKVGTVKQVMGQDGKYYAVTYKADGYDIMLPTGETISFVYDKKTDAWSQIQKGKKTEIFRFNSDGTIQANLPDGTKLNVTPDEAGLYQVRMAMNDGRFFAAR